MALPDVPNQQADICDPSPGPRQGLEPFFRRACVLEDAPLGSKLTESTCCQACRPAGGLRSFFRRRLMA